MRVYLASRYSRRDEMKVYQAALTAAGHTVVARWLETEWANRPDQSSHAPPDYREKYAVIDAEDVRDSDVVISFTEPPSSKASRGGRHVEFGMAYAWGKYCVVVGHRENLFHHLPGIIFVDSPTVNGILAAMDTIAARATNSSS